ncbi:Hypothetical predicted protein, partial [Marmota monax]
LDSDDAPGMKNSLTLESDTLDGSFTNKEQIGEGKQLVQKIQSLLRPTCNFPGLEAQSSE